MDKVAGCTDMAVLEAGSKHYSKPVLEVIRVKEDSISGKTEGYASETMATGGISTGSAYGPS